MDEPDPLFAEALFQDLRALLRSSCIALLALLDQRTDPVGLASAAEVAAEAVDHVGELLLADHPRLDRSPARRHLIDPADVHLAVLSQRQCPWNRRRGHDEKVRRVLRLRCQQEPLRHAEAMLLVNDREAQALVGDLLLKDRMSADEDVDRSVGKSHQDAVACAALLAPGEDRDADSNAIELGEQGRMVLPREDLGRGQQRRLRTALHSGKHRRQCDQSLAGTDVALKEAKHGCHLRHVATDFSDHPALRIGEHVRQIELADQLAGAGERVCAVPPLRLAKEQERQLVRENLIVSETAPRRVLTGFAVNDRERRTPAAPGLPRKEAGLDPLRQLGRALQRFASKFAQTTVREAFRQRIDRLADQRRRPLPRFGDFRVNDLPFVAVLIEPS